MKYMGSKNRISKHILPIMLNIAEQRGITTWVEPFVGGGNMIDKVPDTYEKIGADINPYVIEALRLIRDNPQDIPDLVTEEDYQKAKEVKKINGLTGYIGFALSFGGKWFGGYRRDKAGTKGCIDNMQTQSRRAKQAAIKQSEALQEVILLNVPYDCLSIPDNSLIYCDPPYAGTTKYKDDFNHDLFWEWCRVKSKEGHTVFVSEYTAPSDFQVVWEKPLANTLSKNKSYKPTEKLFLQ